MRSMKYKGYEIQAIPNQLPDSGEWTIKISIARDTGNNKKFRKFGAGNRYKTEDEAMRYCFDLGKQFIDGKIKGCSVVDL